MPYLILTSYYYTMLVSFATALMFLLPVSLTYSKDSKAIKERLPQKRKGVPGFRLAKLLPIGGETTLPIWLIVNTIPTAVPE